MRIPTVAERQAAVRPRRYDPQHVAWYFGGIMAAITATGTVGEVSSSSRGLWQLLVALLFLALFVVLAAYLLVNDWWVPAGVFATAAVVLVPSAGQAFERLIGVWPDDDSSAVGIAPGVSVSGTGIVQDFEPALFVLAVVTILGGLAAFSIVRFPFAFTTVTVATVVAVQLLLPLLVDSPSADERMTTLILTGGMLFLVALVLDSVERRDDAFWWHVVGLFAIAVGLVWYAGPRGDSWAWVAILLIGATLLVLSAPFTRAVWATFGVIGVFAAAAHYLGDVFGSWREPAVLAIVSAAIVGVGIGLQLYERVWERLTRHSAPTPAPAPAEPTPPAPAQEPEVRHEPAPPAPGSTPAAAEPAPPDAETAVEPPLEEPPPSPEEPPPPDGPTRPA